MQKSLLCQQGVLPIFEDSQEGALALCKAEKSVTTKRLRLRHSAMKVLWSCRHSTGQHDFNSDGL